MAKPQGSYLKIKSADKVKAQATDAKQTVATAKADEEAKFHQALDRLSESRLGAWHRSMNDYLRKIRKDGAMAKDDKVRKAVAEVLGEVKELLVKAKDLKALDASLKRPADDVLRAPSGLGTGGAELALVIALVQVLQVLVQLRKGRRR